MFVYVVIKAGRNILKS